MKHIYKSEGYNLSLGVIKAFLDILKNILWVWNAWLKFNLYAVAGQNLSY